MAETNTKNNNKQQDDDNSKIFPQKLMDILEDPSNNDAITWHPNGRCFIIVDRRKFCKHVLPKYFKKSKYTSFTRKLNRWNFTRRLMNGRQVSTYYHEFFQRGKDALCTQMYCNNDRAKFAVACKTDKPEVSPMETSRDISALKPNLSSIYAHVLPFEHKHSPASAARSMEAHLKLTSALMQQQQDSLMMKKDLIHNAVGGKPDGCCLLPKPALSEDPSENLLRRHAFARQQRALEQEALHLRLRLQMMQQQRLSGQRSGFNFCSAA